ncbi:MAG: hypothetical protein A3C43_09380 [Candidatus Schekmanbacteria bacterium RIFCSPHIGHO2_02_FULL_38_11]|uniref:Translation elongation factor EFTu-like domain-containing protein n=1 Tax=Candidatus Schekmanbacteria bacterium RIFCSPLOWO2_12_FULL_38_15 TaxID=1817883 RepID=A0A1F7SE80_9BACT|nr:MAG: hypothetical protein A2043_00680 [Candidatus Schekmanbacteria bacterium GWA2_38_9]OGL49099.1 MAG: hypothetical protein A3H37_03965 [Candidatus Schekmanbacteria bacterium RIFCSPLOWO2_02_FULL_38_14]OGL49225.1 MAG: hypothetical protein A3C43_09380 [Candidatus Schekmanbacteria bacterium RIFCSPHIGHO2_02_FULL_38_11]OGL52075.1 MAG: hypothetical protein A3G31_06550 [Candidatus Schekmanbacteria bacterium RIFCSPLOWO2_12_FULL_38_15]
MQEIEIGKITHFFSKPGVAAFTIENGELKVGDKIHIKGHTTDIEQIVDSIQIEHVNVQKAGKSESIGIKVKDKVREHDAVFKVMD